MPLAAWTSFSRLYYGFPWPNTAYAKLNTGIDRADLVRQGLDYLFSATLHDTITLAVIAVALLVNHCTARHALFRFVGYGIVLNLVYVVCIGGDFMQGRFLSHACLTAVVLLLRQGAGIAFAARLFLLRPDDPARYRPPAALRAEHGPRAIAAVGAVVLGYALVYPHTPLNCRQPHISHATGEFGVVFEREVFPAVALLRYVRDRVAGNEAPDHEWLRIGRGIRDSADLVHVVGPIGMTGYAAGTEKIIVDTLALADPLLARLPSADVLDRRIGHFRRDLPEGYVERLAAGNGPLGETLPASVGGLVRLAWFGRRNPIQPLRLNRFYEKLAIVTWADGLWTYERLKTILLFNLGTYDHLVEGECPGDC